MTGLNYLFNQSHRDNSAYIYDQWDYNTSTITTFTFFSFYLIMNSYIPLDCIVVIETGKLLYVPIMTADTEMKVVDDQGLNEFQSNNYNLLEDTAEIEYIFSDKTGTLTQNVLEFRSVSLV